MGSSLHATFIECLVYIIVGYLYKAVMIRGSEQRGRIRLYSKFIIQVILPVFIFRSIVNLDKFPSGSWVNIAVFIVIEVLSAIAAIIVFRKLDYTKWVTLYVTMFGFNVGVLFYPIIEQVIGAEGVASIAILDILNNLIIYVVLPLIFLFVKIKSEKEEAAFSVELDSDLDNEIKKNKRRENGEYTEIERDDSDEEEEEEEEEEDILDDEIIESNIPEKGKRCGKIARIFEIANAIPVGPEAKEISDKKDALPYYISPNMTKKEIAVRILKYIAMNGPFLFIVVSFICFGAGLKLPTIIDNLLEKISRTLTFLGMALIGMLLDIHPRLVIKNIRWVGITLVTRYAVGTIVTVFNYFIVFPHVSPVIRAIILLVSFMPPPILVNAFVINNGYDPLMTSLAVNSFTVISFFVVWILFTVIDFNQGYSSFSSSSSSSS